MNNTKPTNEQVEAYKKGLKQTCSMSLIGMCPGCGLTPEGLEQIIATTQTAKVEEVLEIVNKVDLSYAVNDGKSFDEQRGGQFACCEIRRHIKNLCPTPAEKTPYNQRDHTHCPDTNSPCGFEGKHRCCLCGVESKKKYLGLDSKGYETGNIDEVDEFVQDLSK